MKKIKIRPTDSELEILQLIWANGPATVKFVNEKLNEIKEVGYTTTLKIMQIMSEKGILERNTESRTHIYMAKVNQDETQQALLDRFLSRAFNGSASKMVMSALGTHSTSKEELKAIKDLINQIEKENGNNR